MKIVSFAAALAAGLGLIAVEVASAQAPPAQTEVGIGKLALTTLPARHGDKLIVSTPAFADGGDIPFQNTQYRGNVFPGLSWSKGPPGVQSYVVIMQDTDGVRNDDAILHWTLFNIPAHSTKLDAGMTAPPAGAMYGPNIRGPNHAYMGPRTPPGPKHRYHLQVFALDEILQGDPTLSWAAMKAAMAGHVLASGQVVGLGQADPTAPPRPRPAN
jgi:para-nitrobenzyl esterase